MCVSDFFFKHFTKTKWKFICFSLYCYTYEDIIFELSDVLLTTCINVTFFFRAGPMVGLILIALGTGGIKPCVSAFGGDQFTPDQVIGDFKQFQ